MCDMNKSFCISLKEHCLEIRKKYHKLNCTTGSMNANGKNYFA